MMEASRKEPEAELSIQEQFAQADRVLDHEVITHEGEPTLDIQTRDGESHLIIIPAGMTSRIKEQSTGSARIDIIVEEGAIVHYSSVSRQGDASRFVLLKRDAQLTWHDAAVENARTSSVTYLSERGANAKYTGVLLGTSSEKYTIAATMIHAASNTSSNMLTKAVMLDHATGVYRGLIRILPEAKGCDAYQRADCLLLGDNSRMDAEPLLEIENNDVKCSHGVAIGQIDNEQLFYMQSRGIPVEQATSMIVQGFFDSVLLQMDDAALNALIHDKLESFDVRGDFPILERCIYLDSAASTQKPLVVIGGMKRFYETSYANVHRGIYGLAEQATAAYEDARAITASFINADVEETIFTRGTTDGLNIIARSLGQTLKPGDEIIVTLMEHHSNFVPWQQIAKQHGCAFNVVEMTPDGLLDMDDFRKKITDKTRIVAVVHVSNVLGTINPIKEIATIAHEHGAVIVVDGAQAVAHMPVDVKELDVDFYAFSGHKLYGPEGIGVLYGRKELLLKLPPSAWGGEMVREVKREQTTWNDIPYKFEPGTPPITQAVGLGLAIGYLRSIGMARVHAHEERMLRYLLHELAKIDGLHIIGPKTRRGSAVSFVVDGIHPHDLAHVLDGDRIAVRAGNHCAQPLHCAKGVDATTRASIGVYTSTPDIDALIKGIRRAQQVFR